VPQEELDAISEAIWHGKAEELEKTGCGRRMGKNQKAAPLMNQNPKGFSTQERLNPLWVLRPAGTVVCPVVSHRAASSTNATLAPTCCTIGLLLERGVVIGIPLLLARTS